GDVGAVTGQMHTQASRVRRRRRGSRGTGGAGNSHGPPLNSTRPHASLIPRVPVLTSAPRDGRSDRVHPSERRRHDSAPRPPGWHSGAMRIVVCVKYVPDLQSERSLDSDGHLVRGLDDAINELDENAVEAAVALAEVEQAEVIALTVGPGDAVDAVRRALQMGVDSGVHVCDERVAGADVVGTAKVLAAAIRTIERSGPI